MNWLYAAAPAVDPQAVSGGSPIQTVLMLVVFGLIFYFMLIRPQSKRAKEHKNLLANLAKGDEVVTSGGVIGKITKVTEQFIVLEIADKVEITVQKPAVVAVLPKGTLKSLE